MRKFFLLLVSLSAVAWCDDSVYTLEQIVKKAQDSYTFRKLAEQQISSRSATDAEKFFFLPKVYLTSDFGTEKRFLKDRPDRPSSDFCSKITAEQPLPLNSSLQISLARNNFYYDSLSSSNAQFNLSYNVKFNYGMTLFDDYLAQQRNANKQDLATKQSELDYQYELFSRFYSMFQAQDILKLEKIGFTLSEKNYTESANKYKAGIIPEVEMLEMELFLRRKELALKQAIDRYQTEKASFMLFCNLSDSSFVLEHKSGVQQEFIVNHDQDLLAAEIFSLTLLSAYQAIAESENAVKSVYSSKCINGNLDLGFTASQDGDEKSFYLPSDSKYLYGRLSLTIPLYQKNEFTNALDYAQTVQKNAKENFTVQKEQLEIDFNAKIRDLKLNFTNLQIVKKNFELSEKIYQISQNRFNNGLITSKDLIQNQLDFFQNEQALVNAEIDYIMTIQRYKKFIGKSL